MYQSEVTTLFEHLWKAEEEGMNSNVHAFTFYMGENIKEGDDEKDNVGEEYLNPFDGKSLADTTATAFIMAGIKKQLDKLKKPLPNGKLTKSLISTQKRTVSL